MIQELAGMAELVDAQDLKSCAEQSACRFDPGSRQEGLLGNREAFFMEKKMTPHVYPRQCAFKSVEDIKDKKVTIMGLGLNGGGEAAVRFFLEKGTDISACRNPIQRRSVIFSERGRESRGGGLDDGGQFRKHGENAAEHGGCEDDGKERGFAHGSVPFKMEEKCF